MKVLPLAAALLFSSLFCLQPALAQSSKNDELKKEQLKKEESKKDVSSKDVPKLPFAVTKLLPESVDDLKAIQEQTKKVVEKVTPCVVGIQIGGASGSGVIVSKDGIVLTAGHVSGTPGHGLQNNSTRRETAQRQVTGTGQNRHRQRHDPDYIRRKMELLRNRQIGRPEGGAMVHRHRTSERFRERPHAGRSTRPRS